MRVDFFDRLPPPTAFLLVSSILDLTSAHVLQQLPRRTDAPTTTIPYHALTAVVSWPLRPTPPPRDLFALRRRQDNTICGYIDGSPDLPATCSAGSHCVLDTDANVVGCCPNGETACTAGVFTGCVDANSGPQTEVNPYVFSCGGDSVCFKNVFEGGFSQFGCGTASDQGTVVVPSASGISTTISYPTITASLTQSISTLSEPTTLGTLTNTDSTRTSTSEVSSSTSSSASSSTDTSTTSTSSTSSETSTSSTSSETSTSSSSSATSSTTAANEATNTDPTNAPAASPASEPNRTGAIVGGTIGGLAVLIALVALIAFLIRRRQNSRDGPGQSPIRGNISTPRPGPGTGFSAISQDSDAFETGPGPEENPMFNNGGNTQAMRNVPGSNPHLSVNTIPMPFQNDVSPADDTSPYAYGGAGMAVSAGASSSRTSYPPDYGQYPPIHGIAGTPVVHGGIDDRLESDQVPLTREIDDFSQGFSAALGRIGEEDEEEDLGDPNRGHMMSGAAGGGGLGGSNHPASATAATDDPHMSAAASSTYSRSSSAARPLWQQNRRQSRNQMWM
ncbi:hypothetical protein QBC35DRAFT_493298 [Podospora australis]|uniref:Mid2 domain-containing protein n=1 Tax=Podospora australis TaxID=1536484 RepID=A0AAN6WWG9_9PEZI|nr:hypothetical protein QBC35DRAFT_493298 [Podospora australis]